MARQIITYVVVVACTAGGTALQAQVESPRRPSDMAILSLLQTAQVTNAPAMAPLVNALLSDTAIHVRVAPSGIATASDSERAAAIIREIRDSLSKYADVKLAEGDGYVRFLPWLEDQIIYHYNSIRNAVAATSHNDLTKPSSLLYRKDADGALRLVGVMYTAPYGASLEELDARLPLSFAHWHQHVNFCGPHLSAISDPGRLKTDSASLAYWLAIDTPEACAAANGVFVPRLFGWMTHVIAFEGEGASIWGHGSDHMSMHTQHDEQHHQRPKP